MSRPQPSAVHLGIPFHAESLPVIFVCGVQCGRWCPRDLHLRCRSLDVTKPIDRHLPWMVRSSGYLQLAGVHRSTFVDLKVIGRIFFYVEKWSLGDLCLGSTLRVHSSRINRYVHGGFADSLSSNLKVPLTVVNAPPPSIIVQMDRTAKTVPRNGSDRLPGGSAAAPGQRKAPPRIAAAESACLDNGSFFFPFCRATEKRTNETGSRSPVAKTLIPCC